MRRRIVLVPMSIEAILLNEEESDVTAESLGNVVGCQFGAKDLDRSLSRIHLEEERVLHHFAENMADENMGLLDAGRAGGRNDQGEISHLSDGTSVISGEGDRFDPHLFSHFESLDDVGGVPGRGDADGNIAFLPKGPELFCEDFAKSKVVGNTGENGSICGQGNCRQRRPIDDISIDKFRSHVLGIGSAPAISEEKKLVPSFKGVRDQFDDIEQFGEILFEEACLDFRAFLKSLQNDIFHWRKYYTS